MTEIRVLRRGRSKRADLFLDWLEDGAFTALKTGHLHALQVYVHTDPDNRARVIEAYTFTISYHHGNGQDPAVSGLVLDSPGSPPVSVQASNQALQQMLRHLMSTCERLPELPSTSDRYACLSLLVELTCVTENRYISMELFYVPSAEQTYSLPAFEAGSGDILVFPIAEGWEQINGDVADVDSAFHT
jgi:hypothetical protein